MRLCSYQDCTDRSNFDFTFAAPRGVCRLYSIGDDAIEIFFVEDGGVEIVWEDVRIPKQKRIQHRVAKVDVTQSLGEEGLLTDDMETAQHVFTGIATQMSTLFYINRAATNRLLYHHPKVRARCQMLIAQKLNRWQEQAQLVLKEHLQELAASPGSENREFGKSLHDYEPKGLLPVPVFSQCGQLVDPKKETDAETAAGSRNDKSVPPTAEGEESTVATLRADMQRLEAKLDKALDALMQ